VDVNQARTNNGASPLYFAAQNGHADGVERLLAAPGVDINQACWDGTTPLFIALARGHAAVALKLREAGATEPQG